METTYRTSIREIVESFYKKLSPEEKIRLGKMDLSFASELESKLQNHNLSLASQEVCSILSEMSPKQIKEYQPGETNFEHIRETIKNNLQYLNDTLPIIKEPLSIKGFPIDAKLTKDPLLTVSYTSLTRNNQMIAGYRGKDAHDFSVRFHQRWFGRVDLQAQGCMHYTKPRFKPFDLVFDDLIKSYTKAVNEHNSSCVDWVNNIFSLYMNLHKTVESELEALSTRVSNNLPKI